jgi:sigma-B regulation protein RsbU (phosphoserine phosphatase)
MPRLRADAAFISRIADLEAELAAMTTELIDRQDRLMALYELTKSLRSSLSIVGMLHALARGVARLIRTPGTVAMLRPPHGEPTIIHFPMPQIDDGYLLRLCERLPDGAADLTLSASSAPNALPGGIEGMLFVPIQMHGPQRAGIVVFADGSGALSMQDAKLVHAIADQAASQLDNVLLYEESLLQARLKTEMELAARIQLRLLPQRMPAIPDLDLWAACRPALHVGGDFYALIHDDTRPFVFAIGDVAGKGMAAALLMSTTLAVINNAARFMPNPTPKSLLQRTSENLYAEFTEVGMFATAFVGQYESATRRLRFANAGHAPVIYRPAAGRARILEADGAPVGVLPESGSETYEVPFSRGDLLVAATDGLNEARDAAGRMFGYDRLLEAVDALADLSARQAGEALFTLVGQYASGHPQDDDQTLLVVKGT